MDRRIAAAPRIAASLARRRLGRWDAIVPFDSGRSRLVADLRTPLGLALYRYPGYWDSDFQVLDELRPGDVFLDCGANIGLFTLVAASRVGPAGHVVSFEPARAARDALTRNVGVSGHGNVTVLPYALSDTSGERSFVVMGSGGGLSSFAPAEPGEGEQVRVAVRTLDGAIPHDFWGRIRMVKLDIEGAEVQALRGASRLLSDERPVLLIEVEEPHLRRQGSSACELTALLSDHGYTGRPTAGPSPNHLFRPAGDER